MAPRQLAAIALGTALLASCSPATSVLSPTDAPSDAPLTTEAPAPVLTAAPTFALIKLNGKGDRIAKFTIPEKSAAIAVITNKGSSNFTVETLAADGTTNELLVNEIGAYGGTVLFDVSGDTHSVALKIGSSGSWTATIKPITAARPWNGTAKLTGKGDDVVLVSPAISGLATATFSHSGESNFAVTTYTTDSSDLVINEIGHYNGQVQLADGTILLSVTADGAWTVTPD